jgi:hypothetical protein
MTMTRSRILYDGEWVCVRGGTCEICGVVRRETVWHSIKTKRVRCFRCFDAEAEQIRKGDYDR